jgi:ribosomal protein S18 acetylase RimI-like enzyme
MPVTVVPVSTDSLAAAARLLFAHEPEPQRTHSAARCRELLATGEMNPAGLFVARDLSLRGTILVQPLPGGLGLAWPPRVEPGPDQGELEDALVAAACDWLRTRGVKVCQAFAAGRDVPAMAPLERHGFRHVTQVSHQRRDLAPDEAQPAVSLAGRFYTPALRALFLRTLLATYDGTRDCPELNGTRTPDEMLDAFGDPGLSRWFLAEDAGAPIGVVMLDSGATPGSTEVAYLGLIPSARGRGRGEQLVRFALREAHAAGSTALTLSVDARNEPALRLYRRHGFAEYDRQVVYLAAWPGDRSK